MQCWMAHLHWMQIKSFSWPIDAWHHHQVWLFITFSMLLGVVVLYGIFYFLTQINRHQQQSKIAAAENRFEKALAVIFGNILVQGTQYVKQQLLLWWWWMTMNNELIKHVADRWIQLQEVCPVEHWKIIVTWLFDSSSVRGAFLVSSLLPLTAAYWFRSSRHRPTLLFLSSTLSMIY